jgi:Tol biopolymer transport system component
MTIAFLSYDNYNHNDIYTVNDDGSQLQNLTSNPSQISFVWSPDGTRIAFSSEWEGNFEIYSMNADGSGLIRLTNNSNYDTSPSWSPDSTRIAFASDRDGYLEIYVMNSDGSNVTRLTDLSVNRANPLWSPDGSKIAFSIRGTTYNEREIYVMNTDGSGQTRLTENAYYDRMLEWSPDGSRILFLSNRDHGGEQYREDVYHMDVVGTDLIRLTTSGYVQAATWSPEGNKIAVSDFALGNENLMIMNVDGSNSTPLLCQSDAILTYDPAWSSDGTKIAYSPFSGVIGDTTGIYVSTIDGLSCLHLTTMLALGSQWKPGE